MRDYRDLAYSYRGGQCCVLQTVLLSGFIAGSHFTSSTGDLSRSCRHWTSRFFVPKRKEKEKHVRIASLERLYWRVKANFEYLRCSFYRKVRTCQLSKNMLSCCLFVSEIYERSIRKWWQHLWSIVAPASAKKMINLDSKNCRINCILNGVCLIPQGREIQMLVQEQKCFLFCLFFCNPPNFPQLCICKKNLWFDGYR